MTNRAYENASQEVELKLRVTGEAQLRAIAQAARGQLRGPVWQINHFFDTPDRVFNRHLHTLRLRDEDRRITLTAKGPGQSSADGVLETRPEVEVEIGPELAAEILNARTSPLTILRRALDRGAPDHALLDHMEALLEGAGLMQIGGFENQRQHKRTVLTIAGLPHELVIELDTSFFPNGIVQYEVEVEIPAELDPVAVHQALAELFARAGVKGTPAPPKAKRFFAALDGLEI